MAVNAWANVCVPVCVSMRAYGFVSTINPGSFSIRLSNFLTPSAQGGHIDTGLHGTYFMYKLLGDRASGYGFNGSLELAMTLTTADDHPGYMDILNNGYTTWPEAWGRCTDHKQPQAPYQCTQWVSGSASPMHGTLNGVGQQFVSAIGGIQRKQGGIGYQHIFFRAPFELAPTTLTHARASLLTPYGNISSSWASDGHYHQHNVSVPPNCVCTVRMPARMVRDVIVNGVPLEVGGEDVQAAVVNDDREGNNRIDVILGSGDHDLSSVIG